MASQLEIISNPRGRVIRLSVCVDYYEAVTSHDNGWKQSENQQVRGHLSLGGGNNIPCNCRE